MGVESTPLLPRLSAGRAQDGFYREAAIMLGLGLPMFMSRAAWVTNKTIDSALLGHVGTEYLSASSLADLWMMVSGVFLQDKTLRVFLSQAKGARQYSMMVGWWIIAMCVGMAVAVPVALCWLMTEHAFAFAGMVGTMPHNAGTYASLLVLAIPGRVFYNQLNQFLQVQTVLKPAVHASALSVFVNAIGGVLFVLGVGGFGYGFVACPLVTTVAEYALCLGVIFLTYRKMRRVERGEEESTHVKALQVVMRHVGYGAGDEESGSEGVMRFVTKERIWEYLGQFLPLSLQFGSDFWRMAVVGYIAALVSSVDVAAFNTSYKVLYIALSVVGSVSSVTGMRIGNKLGAGDVARAKSCAYNGICVTGLFALFFALVLFAYSTELSLVFSSDPEITWRFESIRLPLAFTVFFMNFSIALEQVPIAAGLSGQTFVAGFVSSWVFQVPACYFMYKQQGTLHGVYTGVAIGYGMLCAAYVVIIARMDWEHVAEVAQRRSKEE